MVATILVFWWSTIIIQVELAGTLEGVVESMISVKSTIIRAKYAKRGDKSKDSPVFSGLGRWEWEGEKSFWWSDVSHLERQRAKTVQKLWLSNY